MATHVLHGGRSTSRPCLHRLYRSGEIPGSYDVLLYLCMYGTLLSGCGDTRALHALTHGHVIRAFDYNLLFPFIMIILTWYYLVGLTTLLFRRRVMWIPQSIPKWGAIGIGVVVVLFTVMRNIPVWPFSILAP